MSLFSTDIKKYKNYSGKSSLVLVLTTQGLWAICVYRISNHIYKSELPKIIKKPLLLISIIFQKWIEIVSLECFDSDSILEDNISFYKSILR